MGFFVDTIGTSPSPPYQPYTHLLADEMLAHKNSQVPELPLANGKLNSLLIPPDSDFLSCLKMWGTTVVQLVHLCSEFLQGSRSALNLYHCFVLFFSPTLSCFSGKSLIQILLPENLTLEKLSAQKT